MNYGIFRVAVGRVDAKSCSSGDIACASVGGIAGTCARRSAPQGPFLVLPDTERGRLDEIVGTLNADHPLEDVAAAVCSDGAKRVFWFVAAAPAGMSVAFGEQPDVAVPPALRPATLYRLTWRLIPYESKSYKGPSGPGTPPAWERGDVCYCILGTAAPTADAELVTVLPVAFGVLSLMTGLAAALNVDTVAEGAGVHVGAVPQNVVACGGASGSDPAGTEISYYEVR